MFDHSLKEGIYLHLTDDGDSRLYRKSEIHLIVDKSRHFLLPCVWASNNGYAVYDCVSDVYYQMPPSCLKALAFASTIQLYYITEDDEAPNIDLKIDDFQEIAELFYEKYYLVENCTPKEKKVAIHELRHRQEAINKLKEEERARYELEEEQKKQKEVEKLAEEWESADSTTKLGILLKRHWKLVLLILLILFILFFS